VGCRTKPRSSSSASSCPLCFPCKSRENREPTSGLEPLYCSSYEFACGRSSPSWCVRESRLFRRFSTIWACCFVHCVPVRISPVAGNPFEQTQVADLLITNDN
jgi:hypothetical protein